MGFSAGGYLAASLSNLPDEEFRPAFQILVCPFTAPFRTDTEAIRKANKRLFGEEFSEETLLKYSPEKHIDSSTPRSLIVHARNDEKVPVEHAVALYKELIDASVPAEMHLYQQGDHGFGMKSLQGAPKALPKQLLAWLRENAFHRSVN